jgi:hypothetical protein
MNSRLLCLVGLLSAPALAQVKVDVQVALPTITFQAPPPLVVVQPGVQVVEDFDEEVFFVDGWYWVRRGDRWFRAKDHRGGWVVVEPRLVPVAIVKLPPGQYRHWKAKPGGHGKPKHGKGKH